MPEVNWDALNTEAWDSTECTCDSTSESHHLSCAKWLSILSIHTVKRNVEVLVICQGCGMVRGGSWLGKAHNCWKNENGTYEEGGTFQ